MSSTNTSDQGTFSRVLDARTVVSIIASGSLAFCAIVFETSTNVAIPVMMSELGVDTATIQWITSAYLLVLSVTIPVFPVLKSRYSLRRIFAASTLSFTAGTLLCCTAATFPQLLLGRVIQGLGTGVAMPLMFNVVIDQVPFEYMGMMMGVASLIISLAPAIGPAYGGVVLEAFGWHAMFLFAVPLLAAAFVAGVVCLRQTTKLAMRPFDATGFLLVASGFLLIVVGVNRLSNGELTVFVAALLIAGLILLVQFVRHARRAKYPLVSPGVFSSARFMTSVAAIAGASFVCLGYAWLIPNFTQVALGTGAKVSGLVVIPGCVATMLFSPVAGRLLDRKGPCAPIAVGATLLVLGAILMCIRSLDTVLGLAVWYLLSGMGQGLLASPLMTYGLSSLDDSLRADGTSVCNSLQQLGGSVGVSTVTAAVAAAQSSNAGITTGMVLGGQAAFVVLAIVAAVAVAFSLIALRLAKS
ncbi:MFS transporter [Tractidigestivibacter scatoligenes]|uniref:MFS transporter n=1 Tax=Tractidigestivibacter scatoligenes TaxID=1299998 RepID=UPI002F35DD78